MLKIKQIIWAILLLPITLTFGLLLMIICLIERHFAVWQLSDRYKTKHRGYYINGKFNPIQFVLSTEIGGDKGRVEMWKH